MWIPHFVDHNAIPIALASRSEPRAVSTGDRSGGSHCDVFGKILVEAENPSANGDIANAVKCDELALGVNAGIGPASPSQPPYTGIDRAHSTENNLFHRADPRLSGPAVKFCPVIRDLEQDSAISGLNGLAGFLGVLADKHHLFLLWRLWDEAQGHRCVDATTARRR
jgi:hypothetical protein